MKRIGKLLSKRAADTKPAENVPPIISTIQPGADRHAFYKKAGPDVPEHFCHGSRRMTEATDAFRSAFRSALLRASPPRRHWLTAAPSVPRHRRRTPAR